MTPLLLLLTIVLVTSSCVTGDVLVYSFWHILMAEFRDIPARFGDPLPSDGIKGRLVAAKPVLACEPILPPPSDEDEIPSAWIVLIKRGNCSFEQKIRNAQTANYSAAIVHNVNSSSLEPMSATHPEGIHIPSVFVGDEAGAFLRDKYVFSKGCYVVINDDLPFNINTTLLLPFVAIVGACFLIMLIVMIVRCIKNRQRQRRHRLPASSLRKIPTAKFQKGDPYETCAICLEDYLEGDKLRVLPCSHAYHSKCIDPWLTRNRRVCPVCKRRVFAHDEQVSETESDTDTDDTTPLLRQPSSVTQGGTFSSPSQGAESSGDGNGRAHVGAEQSPAASGLRAVTRHLRRTRRHQNQQPPPQSETQPVDTASSDSGSISATSTCVSSEDSESLYASVETVDETRQSGGVAVLVSSADHSINSDSSSGAAGVKDVIV